MVATCMNRKFCRQLILNTLALGEIANRFCKFRIIYRKMSASNIKNYNPWLDLFRGMAALLVCVGHIRNAFLVDYGDIQVKAWWHVPAYLVTSFGHQAVIIFFVLSGFLVGGGVLVKGKDFSWTDYFSARLIRLWLVLIPALLFTAACDFLTLRILPSAFNGALSSLWNSGPSTLEGVGWKVFIANVLFLQTIVFPVFGSNGPLWSLANEFWYYILFPLIVCGWGYTGIFGFLRRVIMLVLAIVIILWLPREIIFYFFLWLMGVACFLIIRKNSPRINMSLTVISAIFFLGSLLATKFLAKDNLMIWLDFTVGLLFSILLICLNGHQVPWKIDGLLGAVIRKFSDFSYSLYLFHFPLVILLAATTVRTAQLQPDVGTVTALFATTGLCLAVAWSSWLLFEQQNNYILEKVRRMIARMLILRARITGNWSSN